MISVKTEGIEKDGKKGTSVELHLEGYTDEIVLETLAVIRALMSDIKNQDILAHVLCIRAIAENPEILGVDDEAINEADLMAEKMSRMTDECVLN